MLIIDDVISAGTSVRESLQMIQAVGATPCGVAIALDRQEKSRRERRGPALVGRAGCAAAPGLPVVAIAGLADLLAYLDAALALAAHRPADASLSGALWRLIGLLRRFCCLV